MAVRTRVLAVVDQLQANATTTVYTCPPGRTALIHTLSVANRSTDPRRYVVAVRSSGVSASIYRNAVVQPDTAVSPPGGPWALNPGDSLEVFSGGNASTLTSVYVSGSLLEGEPT